MNKRDYYEEGETQDQYNYHCQEKDFIINQLYKDNESPNYDVHKLRFNSETRILDGPIGMDPCQTLVQFAYAKIKET